MKVGFISNNGEYLSQFPGEGGNILLLLKIIAGDIENIDYWEKILEYHKHSDIVLYGASANNEKILTNPKIKGRIRCIVDRDETKNGCDQCGVEIRTIQAIQGIKTTYIISFIADKQGVIDALNERNINYYYCFYPIYNAPDIIKSNNNILNKPNRWKVLHFIPNDVFFRIIYNMINEYGKMQDHLFIVNFVNNRYRELTLDYINKNNNDNILVCDDLQFIPDMREKNYLESVDINKVYYGGTFENILENIDRVIFHSLFMSKRAVEVSKHITDYVKNSFWVSWGGDRKIWQRESDIRLSLIKKIEYISCSPKVSREMKPFYSNKIYQNSSSYTIYPKVDCVAKEIIKTDPDTKRILLGHSGYEYGEHIKGIEYLSRFKNENICIICPLSYGNDEYIKKVRELGETIFGDKFISLTGYMELNDYYSILTTIDIAVFPLSRLAGYTNIVFLNLIGKSIFMTDLAGEYLAPRGVRYRNFEEITKISFSDFCNNEDNVVDREAQIEKHNMDLYKEWEKLFYDTV